MADMGAIQESFFQECDDLLEALFEGLAQMEGGETDPETVNAVFRAVHSIKGGAGAFKLGELVSFAHTVETVLDQVRSNTRDVTPELMQLMLRAADQLANLVEAAQGRAETNAETRDTVLGELEALLGDVPDEEEIDFAPMTLDLGEFGGALDPVETTLRITFRPHPKLYANGHEPAHLFAALAEQGTLDCQLDFTDVPSLSAYDPDGAYLTWRLTFTGIDADDAVEDVFEFVEGLCDLTIEEAEADTAGPFALPQVGVWPTADDKVEDQPAIEASDAAVSTASQPPSQPEMSVTKPAMRTAAKPTLRVDLDRVDRLINTVGELIINQAVLTQRLSTIQGANSADIEADLDEYKLLARDLQEGVMAIRAQPVKSLFQRMSRIVREASAATGKSARLTIRGETTEVDKTVIERLADPLTHMIRNAIDHGLEAADDRIAAGKPPEGEIMLSASHKSGNVLIEIADDGAGLNRPKILDIAVSKGLISANAELSDGDIDQLLFMPGFSTAASVSDLSGRGVGMDVVKNAIQALGGRVSINSVLGQGTTFSIVLPLTLAVMDGMVVSVADETMVIPITPILETIRPGPGDIEPYGADARLLVIRGRHVPIVDVAKSLALKPRTQREDETILVLVETEEAGQRALAVNAIHDQRQVVIKSVAGNYGDVPGVSAATILGDGSIALILDVDYLVRSKSANPDLIPEPVLEMEV